MSGHDAALDPNNLPGHKTGFIADKKNGKPVDFVLLSLSFHRKWNFFSRHGLAAVLG